MITPQSFSSWKGFLPHKCIVMARFASEKSPTSSCPHCRQAKIQGEGDPQAELFFIQASPLTDEARALFDRMLQAMGLNCQQIYLLSIQRCPELQTPPENNCHSFLMNQLRTRPPRMIVTLGQTAAQILLQTTADLNSLRGNFKNLFERTLVLPTLHPSELLQNPRDKREAWTDLQAVATQLDMRIPHLKK